MICDLSLALCTSLSFMILKFSILVRIVMTEGAGSTMLRFYMCPVCKLTN